MPKASSKPKKTIASAVPPTTTDTTPAMAQIWADIMQESAHFLSQRLQENLATQHALLMCKTPQGVVQVHSEFIFTAMQHYADEAQRISNIMTKASDDFTKLAGQSSSRAYDDIPL
ncbi:MAG: phasin family protein [Pseudomonadota bacterium]